MYWFADFNLAIPVLVHAVYDVVTVWLTWRSAAKELANRLETEERRLKNDAVDFSEVEDEFDTLCGAVFDVIDIDRNGSIDPHEFAIGMRLFG
jgi:hypothetical protein